MQQLTLGSRSHPALCCKHADAAVASSGTPHRVTSAGFTLLLRVLLSRRVFIFSHLWFAPASVDLTIRLQHGPRRLHTTFASLSTLELDNLFDAYCQWMTWHGRPVIFHTSVRGLLLTAINMPDGPLSWPQAQNLAFFLGIRSAKSMSLILAARMKSLSVSAPEWRRSHVSQLV